MHLASLKAIPAIPLQDHHGFEANMDYRQNEILIQKEIKNMGVHLSIWNEDQR